MPKFPRILVVGGAGYIGSHMVKFLGGRNCDVVTLDNLCSGSRGAVLCGQFIEGDLSNSSFIDDVLLRGRFDAVMHFAAHIQVAESVLRPEDYYLNNVVNSLNLMRSMRMAGVNNLIFSSTAAVFGEPVYFPIDECHPRSPINPYGQTKLMVEQILEDYDRAYGLRSVCLRYFNAAGADPEGQLGECHLPETHLIPLVMQAASGRRPFLTIFGRDFDTPDGTCIRDYVHVWDLCQAHWIALQSLISGGGSARFNLGNDFGFSVQEVVDAAYRVTGVRFRLEDRPRREGDPARLVADSRLIRNQLFWRPVFQDIDTILSHAWAWERQHFSC